MATVTAWLADDYFPPGTSLEDLILPQARVQSCLDDRPPPQPPMPLDLRTRSLDVDDRVSLVLRIIRGENAATLAMNAGMDAGILRRWVHHFIDGGRDALEAEQDLHSNPDPPRGAKVRSRPKAR